MRDLAEARSPLMEGKEMMNHPEHLLMLADRRQQEAAAHHLLREGLEQRPRPPGRLRLRAADLLARAAARLADEPALALRREPAR